VQLAEADQEDFLRHFGGLVRVADPVAGSAPHAVLELADQILQRLAAAVLGRANQAQHPVRLDGTRARWLAGVPAAIATGIV